MSKIANIDKIAEQFNSELREAFVAGWRAGAQDTLDTLQDYSAAGAGVYQYPDKFIEVHASLMTYYTQILGNSKYDKEYVRDVAKG